MADGTGPADPATARPIFSAYLITIMISTHSQILRWVGPGDEAKIIAKQPKLDKANRYSKFITALSKQLLHGVFNGTATSITARNCYCIYSGTPLSGHP